MDKLLQELALTTSANVISLGYSDFIIALGLTFVLAAFITLVYRFTHSGLSYSRSFAMTMVLMSITIAFIMMIIGSNLARAFSLVGALSIIRFRNAVKDSRDTSYIFLAMAIGMACGVRLYSFAILFTGFSSFVIMLFERLNFADSNSQERLLQVSTPVNFAGTKDIEQALAAKSKGKYYLLSSEVISGDRVSTYSLEIPKKKISGEMIDDFANTFPQAQFKVMAGFEKFNV